MRGKLLAMNLRRLPAWVLSRAHHAAREGVWPDYRPVPMPSAGELAESTLPDQRLEHFAFRGPLRVERWLRLEHLREDFLALVVRPHRGDAGAGAAGAGAAGAGRRGLRP